MVSQTPEIKEKKPFAIDLFAGAGGLSLGFEEAGFDVAAAVEYDPVHAAVHEYNFPQTSMFCCDVRELNGKDIRDKTRIGDEEVAVVFGGPPCQGISLIGKRNVDDERNSLLKEFTRIVLEIRPRYFVMENVAGLLVGKHRSLLDEVIGCFEDSGYSVLQPRVLQAAEYGVPQSRKRLFLIGARGDVSLPCYPKPCCTPRRIDGGAVEGALPLGPSVWDALGDLPDVDNYDELTGSDEAEAEFEIPSIYASLLRDTENDPSNFAAPRFFDPARLTSSARTNHTQRSIGRFANTAPGTTEPVSRFLRLHPLGVSNTLRAGTASDRGAYTAPRPIHPKYPRVITVREAARLHGYPDWFRFHVTKWNGFREVGNSVPVFLGRAVAQELIRSLGFSPRKSAEVLCGDPKLLSFTQREAERYYGIEERVIPQRARKG